MWGLGGLALVFSDETVGNNECQYYNNYTVTYMGEQPTEAVGKGDGADGGVDAVVGGVGSVVGGNVSDMGGDGDDLDSGVSAVVDEDGINVGVGGGEDIGVGVVAAGEEGVAVDDDGVDCPPFDINSSPADGPSCLRIGFSTFPRLGVLWW